MALAVCNFFIFSYSTLIRFGIPGTPSSTFKHFEIHSVSFWKPHTS